MLTLFSFVFFCFFLFGFSSFFSFSHLYIFLGLGVWISKLVNPKLGNRPQLWPVLPPACPLGLRIHYTNMSRKQFVYSLKNYLYVINIDYSIKIKLIIVSSGYNIRNKFMVDGQYVRFDAPLFISIYQK